MEEKYLKIAQELGVSLKQIDTVLTLTAEEIPFLLLPDIVRKQQETSTKWSSNQLLIVTRL